MNILVVGGGAREHAICEAVSRAENTRLYSVMHNCNPGIEELVEDYLLESETNISHVVTYALEKNIDIALIGPEAPLEKGIVNALQENSINACAPTKQAARIETDKEWMRNLLQKYSISGQLKYEVFSESDAAVQFVEELGGQVAIKPIGLTGGKGVRVAGDHFSDLFGARSYIEEVLQNRIGGASKVLIEEKAQGEEFTVQAFSDGTTILPLVAVQDHKRLLPDDKGPNTGGMGSYSAADGLLPFLPQQQYDRSVEILQDIVTALYKEKCAYIGPIYGQFMLTSNGPRIIEINARFGDPEAMNVLPILKTDYVLICQHMLNSTLCDISLDFLPKATVCKYVVPEGYGVKSMANERILIDNEIIKSSDSYLFYASVDKGEGYVTTTTSRSVAILSIADSISDAEGQCELALKGIKGDHIYIRHDIGTKSLIEKRLKHMQLLQMQ